MPSFSPEIYTKTSIFRVCASRQCEIHVSLGLSDSCRTADGRSLDGINKLPTKFDQPGWIASWTLGVRQSANHSTLSGKFVGANKKLYHIVKKWDTLFGGALLFKPVMPENLALSEQEYLIEYDGLYFPYEKIESNQDNDSETTEI